MTTFDPHLIVRAASLYVAVVLTVVACAWRRPDKRMRSGAILGFAWNLPALLLLHLAAARFHWWHFDAQGGVLSGVPVDLYLSWAWLWGAVPAIAFPSLSLWFLSLMALTTDLLLMPLTAPVVQLGPHWLIGESIGLTVVFMPAQLLARWTMQNRRLVPRALLQMIVFTGLLFLVLPITIIEGSGGTWRNPALWPGWQLSVLIHLLALPMLLGLTAVQEFLTRGLGTPVPFDPPQKLVTTGIYAYLGNPMQLSAVLLLFLVGLALNNPWLAASGVMAHLYSAGVAGWNEDEDLRERFGDRWIEYRRNVRRWLPRLHPWHAPDAAPSKLFVSETCGKCREVAAWFARRGAANLVIVPAESHSSGALQRITYEPGDGTRAASGVEAIARALEHIHFGWAVAGFLIRLPVVCELVQLVVDASGGEPRILVASNEPVFSEYVEERISNPDQRRGH